MGAMDLTQTLTVALATAGLFGLGLGAIIPDVDRSDFEECRQLLAQATALCGLASRGA